MSVTLSQRTRLAVTQNASLSLFPPACLVSYGCRTTSLHVQLLSSSAALMYASMSLAGMVQALEKELANFGKEKDKHMKTAQAKAKKAKTDTEVMVPLLPRACDIAAP